MSTDDGDAVLFLNAKTLHQPWNVEFKNPPVLILYKPVDLRDRQMFIFQVALMSVKHGVSVFQEDTMVSIVIDDDEKMAKFRFYRNMNIKDVWYKCGQGEMYETYIRDPKVMSMTCFTIKKVSDEEWDMYNVSCNRLCYEEIRETLRLAEEKEYLQNIEARNLSTRITE